jgi:hypothetical protein
MQRETKTKTKRSDSVLMSTWLKCWHVAESTLEVIGDWILQSTKPIKNCNNHRHNRKKSGWRQRGTALVMTVLAMQANATIATERMSQFDTDSDTIGVDNRCSGCISHVRDDFVGNLRPSGRVVKGFAGSKTTNVQVGTLRWSWEDELGAKHTFDIPNSYYVPEGRVRLLSPQHWSQTQTKGTERDKCGEYTNGRECILFWGGGNYKLRIPIGKRDNVATFPMASGYKKFKAFCCEAELDESTSELIALPSGFVSDEEDDDEIEASEDSGISTWKSPNDLPKSHHLNGPSSPPSKGKISRKAPTATPQQPKTADMTLPRTTNVNIVLDEEDR